MDVLTRYDTDGSPLHLRCHFVDVSERVAAERELRSQSRRLAETNSLLRESNAGLERLKESYRDLYHRAPALYFSLDPHGRFAACNDTMLGTLGYSRDDLLGKPYTRLLTPEGRAPLPSGCCGLRAQRRNRDALGEEGRQHHRCLGADGADP